MRNFSLLFKEGSILAYSLIILGILIAAVTAMTIATTIEKKNASSSQFSVQAYQTADSGIRLAIKAINGYAVPGVPRFVDIFPSCGSENHGEIVEDGGVGVGTYTISFYDHGGSKLVCGDSIRDASGHNVIGYIKSVGAYKGTVRAVEVEIN